MVRRIAAGGMGTVHEGVDERLGRRVAVKLLKEEHADDPRFVERFGREARAAASLGHPNIAQVFDSGHDGGQHFIVMEFVEGEHLGQLLRERGRFTPRDAVGVGSQVCSALAAAHAAGIVHRDIKPGNLLVRPDGQVKVTDFGIAQMKGQTSLTGTGAVLGTAQYLSPEQASDQGATPASDLYSVGVLLFQMLTGTLPFTDESPVAVALSHIRERVPSVHELAPDVPTPLAAVVARATDRDPQQRYASAAQMEQALRHALAAPAAATPTAVLSEATAATGQPSGLRGRVAAVPGSWRLGATGLLLAGAIALGWMVLAGSPLSPQGEGRPANGRPEAPHLRLSARPASATPRTSAPTPSTKHTASGPVVPANAVGSDIHALEDSLKRLGYDVQKVDTPSTAPKDSVLASIPRPGHPLTASQTVILIDSQGQPPMQPTQYVVPGWIVGSDAKNAEQQLKDQHVEVKKVDVQSGRRKDTVLATYPAPGTNADAGIVVLAVSTGE